MGSEYFGSNDSVKDPKEEEDENDVFSSSKNEKILQQVQKIGSKGFLLERRVSPRLRNVPKHKRPYYGSGQRRLNASENITAKESLCQHVPKISSQGSLLDRRFSPRLRDISPDKRPYYGSDQRWKLNASKCDIHDKRKEDNDGKRQLGSPKDNAGKGKAKSGVTVKKKIVQQVFKIRSDESLLEQTLCPRLKSAPLDKRLYYSSYEGMQVNATKHCLCDRKSKDVDQIRILHSPNYDGSEQVTKVDHPIQECLPVAINGAEDKDTESDLGLGVARVERDDTSIMDLEGEAYLERSGSETCLADSMHQRFGERAKQKVQGSTAFSPQVLAYEGIKQEADVAVVDVTMRKKVQWFRNIQLKGLLLEKRVSPRLKNIPEDKRPYYGSSQTRQLKAVKDNVSRNDDQKRQLHSPKDISTKKKTKVDCALQICQLNVAWKDIIDSDTKCWLAETAKGEKTEIVDLEKGAYLKSRLVADHMSHRASARMKQTVRNLNKQHPYFVQDCCDRERASQASCRLLGLVCEDISYGKEDIPIPVTNLIDPPLAPTGFTYITSIQVAKNVIVPRSSSGCSCKGNCTNPKTCSCARLNGSDFPYVRKDGGRLIEPKAVVFECGPECGCGPNCINRISQRKIKYQLEVYRTQNKGWAVRSWDFIPSGAPVCEYIGVLTRCADLDNADVDNVSENDYIFEIDCWHTMHGIGGRERRQGDVSKHARDLVKKVDEAESETEFCIDGVSHSNVTRFINHSCDPNLFVQCVLSSHRDVRFARIVLFAADDIPPMQELAYDYGYALNSVTGPDGKIKKKPCYCGTSECRGRLY